MHRPLLGLAALGAASVFTTPAEAQDPSTGDTRIDNPRVQPGQFATPPLFDQRLCRDGGGDDGSRGRNRCNFGVFMNWNGGEWALYNNRSWLPGSYNDWWHDRPDRAYPRWVQHNRNCEPDRMWWSGKGWHC